MGDVPSINSGKSRLGMQETVRRGYKTANQGSAGPNKARIGLNSVSCVEGLSAPLGQGQKVCDELAKKNRVFIAPELVIRGNIPKTSKSAAPGVRAVRETRPTPGPGNNIISDAFDSIRMQGELAKAGIPYHLDENGTIVVDKPVAKQRGIVK